MKNYQARHRISKPIIISLLIILFLSLAYASVVYSQDTLAYQSYAGKIIDENTGKPVVFANVVIRGTSMGTVTNSDGDFLIKVPGDWNAKEVEITHIGYESRDISFTALENNPVISLTATAVPIEGVVVSYGDPVALLKKAIRKIPENYSSDPVMMRAFYRETIKQNRNYVAMAEAVVDIYKAEYKTIGGLDRTKIYKGRKSQDSQKMDTLVVKLQGGPYVSLMLDLAKHPRELLDEEYMGMFDYTYGGMTSVQGKQALIIEFSPKPYIETPAYAGKIYIESDSYAIIGVDYRLDETHMNKAAEMFIRRKPSNVRIDILGANYLIKYRVLDQTWHLSYVRYELDFRANWRKKLFNSRYALMGEMAVTDVDPEHVVRYKFRESTKFSDILAEQVSQFEDPDFWGENNIIKPDESIEEAIEKLNKKLKRRN